MVERMITAKDLKLMLQKPLHFLLKIEVLKDDGKTILDTLKGVVIGGTASIDSASSIRRTFSASLIPTLHDNNNTKITEEGLVWLNKELRIYVGVMDIRTGTYTYYPLGHYVYTSSSGSYDAATNQLTITCSDYMSKLDGTKNGQIGAFTTRIPAYEENAQTGEIIKHNIIREAVISVLKQSGGIDRYMVDDMGEYKALPQNNEDWKNYRAQNPLWNAIPYDLEFSSGCTVLSILETLRDLYPHYEMFFDKYNVFTCRMIPSCYKDDIIFSNEFLQRIYISENTSIDMTAVRNICEVWGKVIEADFYTEQCSYQSNTYHCSIDGYDEAYYNGDTVAVKIPSVNAANPKLDINHLGAIPILDENTESPVARLALEKDAVFVFKIKSKRTEGQTTYNAYLLGHWQAHGMNVLTDGTVGSDYTFQDGTICPRYSKKYFQKKYNCESVELEIIPNSPFTVQKLGEIPDIKTGGDYDRITSDSLALSRAKWENWKNSRLTDKITLTTNLIPFYDVNMKVLYQTSCSSAPKQYIIQSVSHDFGTWTSTLSLMKFYPLYDDIIREMGTHRALSNYKHGTLSQYTHHKLTELIGGDPY